MKAHLQARHPRTAPGLRLALARRDALKPHAGRAKQAKSADLQTDGHDGTLRPLEGLESALIEMGFERKGGKFVMGRELRESREGHEAKYRELFGVDYSPSGHDFQAAKSRVRRK